MGGYHVNDVRRFGRAWRIEVQGGPVDQVKDISELKVPPRLRTEVDSQLSTLTRYLRLPRGAASGSLARITKELPGEWRIDPEAAKLRDAEGP
jgi:hypothetical protein